MAGNVVSNVKKYYGGQVPVPGQGDSDGKVKVLVKKTATMEIGGVQTEVELLFDSDDLTTPVTPQQLGQWTDENYLIAFKYRNDEGVVRGFILYALETDSTSTDTLVNRATFVNFKEDMNDPGASAYVFEMVEDSSTLTRYLRDENGELIVKFNQASVEAGAQSGTLHELIDTDTSAMYFEVVHEDGKSYLRLNTEGLGGILDDMNADIAYIIGALDELPSDEHGYFNSSLYTTPGDGTTTNIVMDDFRIAEGRDVSGENIEFVPTRQEGGVDFGNVYLEPGTYILAIQYTLQWVGNPRGTFLPKVCSVADQPFDFSYEHEDVIRVTRIVTKTTRGKLVTNIPIDADTPPMGVWVKNMEVVQVATFNHSAVAHDTTLTGTGKLSDPLGITPAAFGKIKDIPTSINQFCTGDVIPVDGPNGPAKMPKDDLLKETAQNALNSVHTLPDKNEGYLALNDANGTGKFNFTNLINNITGLKKNLGTFRDADATTIQLLANYEDTEGQATTARYRARNAVPQSSRKSGTVLMYRLNGNPVCEFIAHSQTSYGNVFLNDTYWTNVLGKRILKNPDAYYSDGAIFALDNYLKDVICSDAMDLHLFFSLTGRKNLTAYAAKFVDGVFENFVGKIENLPITTSRETLSDNERLAMTRYRDSDPDVVLVVDTYRIAHEQMSNVSVGSTTPTSKFLKNSAVNVSVQRNGNVGNHKSVFAAVASHSEGACSVGSVCGVVLDKSVVIPTSASEFNAKRISDAFSVSLNGMNKVPVFKNVELVRAKYNNELLYVATASRDRVYFTYAPNRHVYNDLYEFESRYMFFADKHDLSQLIKIEFPEYMPGGTSNAIGRKFGFFELSNGDALVECANGPQVNASVRRVNLYKISGFRNKPIVSNTVTIESVDLTLVCTFVGNSRLTSFHSFEEYSNGKILMAPYGSGKTARVYVSSDYGSTFELIFCGDSDNTEIIPVKQTATGDGTGAWPDASHVLGDEIDWSLTLNGNVHVHGIAYDKYYDRIWVVTGDGNTSSSNCVTGIWWTDDVGTTWHKYGCMARNQPFNNHGTQMIGIIPLPKCVLFATDGEGDGFYRWNRTGKNGSFTIEGCYQFTGSYAQLQSLGGKFVIGQDDGIVYQIYHPNDASDVNFVGGIVATHNGYDFCDVYKDQFAIPGDVSTSEIYWNSAIADFGDKLVIGAYHGGYIVAYK